MDHMTAIRPWTVWSLWPAKIDLITVSFLTSYQGVRRGWWDPQARWDSGGAGDPSGRADMTSEHVWSHIVVESWNRQNIFFWYTWGSSVNTIKHCGWWYHKQATLHWAAGHYTMVGSNWNSDSYHYCLLTMGSCWGGWDRAVVHKILSPLERTLLAADGYAICIKSQKKKLMGNGSISICYHYLSLPRMINLCF